eukprot:scaffold26005_cov105-Isochrysis_galbana.AAC.2
MAPMLAFGVAAAFLVAGDQVADRENSPSPSPLSADVGGAGATRARPVGWPPASPASAGTSARRRPRVPAVVGRRAAAGLARLSCAAMAASGLTTAAVASGSISVDLRSAAVRGSLASPPDSSAWAVGPAAPLRFARLCSSMLAFVVLTMSSRARFDRASRVTVRRRRLVETASARPELQQPARRRGHRRRQRGDAVGLYAVGFEVERGDGRVCTESVGPRLSNRVRGGASTHHVDHDHRGDGRVCAKGPDDPQLLVLRRPRPEQATGADPLRLGIPVGHHSRVADGGGDGGGHFRLLLRQRSRDGCRGGRLARGVPALAEGDGATLRRACRGGAGRAVGLARGVAPLPHRVHVGHVCRLVPPAGRVVPQVPEVARDQAGRGLHRVDEARDGRGRQRHLLRRQRELGQRAVPVNSLGQLEQPRLCQQVALQLQPVQLAVAADKLSQRGGVAVVQPDRVELDCLDGLTRVREPNNHI